MATTVNGSIKIVDRTKTKFNLKDFTSTALMKFSESIYDMIITVAVMTAALIWMALFVHPYLVDLVSGYYIFGMVIQLMIRIVHRFDDSYTTDEVGQQLARFEDEWNTRWTNFINNYIP